MYVRLLFILLAALNLGAAGWLLFADAPPGATPPATDPGVPELQLVAASAAPSSASAAAAARAPAHAGAPAPGSSHLALAAVPPEAPPGILASAARSPAATVGPQAAMPPRASVASVPARAAHPASAASTSAPAAPLPHSVSSVATAAATAAVCTSLGPFTNEAEVRAALQTLSPHIARIRYREVEANHPHGYWVYLPSLATRAEAQAEARALAAKGVRDYYIVGNTSDAPNAISLGVYNDSVNAQNRVAQVEKLGFAAEVKRRVDAEPEYWLDFAVTKDAAFRWQEWLPDRKDLAAKPIGCF